MKQCVFCKKSPPEIKISKEHVLRAHLAKAFPVLPVGTIWDQIFVKNGAIESENSPVGKTRDMPINAFEFTINDVCKTCNEGWLENKVEVPVEDVLHKLIAGKNPQISIAEVNGIALWASKTAAVRGLMDPEPRGIPTAHYTYIMDNLLPPPHTHVWIAKNTTIERLHTRHFRFFTKEEDTSYQSGHLTTFVIGHLVLFVLGTADQTGEDMCTDTIQAFKIPEIIKIWPEISNIDIKNLPAISLNKITQLSATAHDIKVGEVKSVLGKPKLYIKTINKYY